jgi:hypothetical protein
MNNDGHCHRRKKGLLATRQRRFAKADGAFPAGRHSINDPDAAV